MLMRIAQDKCVLGNETDFADAICGGVHKNVLHSKLHSAGQMDLGYG